MNLPDGDTPLYNATVAAHEIERFRVQIDATLDRVARSRLDELLPEVEAALREAAR